MRRLILSRHHQRRRRLEGFDPEFVRNPVPGSVECPIDEELVTSIVTAPSSPRLLAGVSIQFATPIDRALPFLAVVGWSVWRRLPSRPGDRDGRAAADRRGDDDER